jgi:glycosyltransferase involved in cell wall biosynthesis
LISVSNLVLGKRVGVLIRAFARASQAHRAMRLVIVGQGADAPALERLAHESGIAGQVEFTGGLTPEGVRERLWKANALVMPSAFETFGVVLVEALATGIPVVATRCGGPEDIVDDRVGLLVEPDDEEALAAALLTVASRPYSPNDLRASVRDRFSFGHVAQELLHVYASVRAAGSTQGLHSWERPTAQVW